MFQYAALNNNESQRARRQRKVGFCILVFAFLAIFCFMHYCMISKESPSFQPQQAKAIMTTIYQGNINAPVVHYRR